MKRIAIAALAITLATGCSWTFSRPPARTYVRTATGVYLPVSNRAYPPPLCKPSYAPALLDTYNAAAGGALTLWALSEATDTQADTFGLLAAITAGMSTMWAASAHYGFKQARACREQREELARLQPSPMWIAPSVPPGEPEDWPPEVEQHVDVDENQVDVHTTIRRAPK